MHSPYLHCHFQHSALFSLYVYNLGFTNTPLCRHCIGFRLDAPHRGDIAISAADTITTGILSVIRVFPPWVNTAWRVPVAGGLPLSTPGMPRRTCRRSRPCRRGCRPSRSTRLRGRRHTRSTCRPSAAARRRRGLAPVRAQSATEESTAPHAAPG